MSELATRARGLPRRRGVTPTRVLRSEWVTAWTSPTTGWCAAATVVLHAVVALWSGYNAEAPGAGGLSSLLTLGLIASQVPLVLFGVITSTAEHHDGGARATYLAVPRRLPVLAARAITVAAVAALTAMVALGATWLLLLPFQDHAGVTLLAPDGDLARVVVGTLLYLAAVTVLSLAIGAIVRRQAAAAVAAISLLVLAEQVLTMLGSTAAMTIRTVLPGWAGRLVATPTAGLPGAELGALRLDPWQGYGILVAWTVIALAIAALVVRRSDV